jgi:hypothetical protein
MKRRSIIGLKVSLTSYNSNCLDTFGRFMQDLTNEHEEQIRANQQLRQEINKIKAQVQEMEKVLASMKITWFF